jgi:hypothetical protein
LPPEQVERVWNATAEKFKQLEAVLKVTGDPQLYTECEQNRKYVAGLFYFCPAWEGHHRMHQPERRIFRTEGCRWRA